MKVAVVGATGKTGSRIVTELLSRAHEVVAIARNLASLPDLPQLTGKVDNLSDPAKTAALIGGTDALVSAYAPPPENTDELVDVTARLVASVKQAAVPRLIVVGGA